MQTDISSAFEQVVKNRRAVRGFLPQPVDQTLLEQVFELAQKAPSNCNTQPWQVAVASGDACERLRQKIPTAMAVGEISMDFPYDGLYDGIYKERQHGAAAERYSAMGIERSDKAGRGAAFMRNFEFFGAPHVAFLFLPEPFGLREAADVGMYAQTLMLSLTAHGLASCPQTALGFHADLVRSELGVPENHKLLFGISFGYEDVEASANRCRVERAALMENIRFVE